MMTGLGWGMGFSGWLPMALGIVLLIVIVWAMVAAIARGDRPAVEDAGQILRARFARGEISQEEYEQARRLLGV